MRAHFDGCAYIHPHAIEAARQITGSLVQQGKSETETETEPEPDTDSLFPEPARPELLHEPYMSASGAAGLLSQTLTGVAGKLDLEAEVRSTLVSPEFRAFRALVASVYIGSLQKRADFIEKSTKAADAKARLQDQAQAQVQGQAQGLGPAVGDARGGQRQFMDDGKTTSDETKTSLAETGRARKIGGGSESGDSIVDGGAKRRSDNKPGVAPASYQACSGDIAQALVAITMGDGFDRFLTASDVDGGVPRGGGGGGVGEQAWGVSQSGGRGAPGSVSDSYRGGRGRGGGGGSGSRDDAEKPDARRSLQSKSGARSAAAALQYLCEDETLAEGLASDGEKGNGVKSAAVDARFLGLEWLAPHIVGRSIPMPLRYLLRLLVVRINRLTLCVVNALVSINGCLSKPNN